MSYVPEFLAGRVVVTDGGCWGWLGAKDRRGYGRWSIGGRKSRLAYRYVYEIIRGPVESGFELDHLCRHTDCVNPWHLEPVHHVENVRRGAAGAVNAARMLARTHCKHGHAYSPENTYVNCRGHRNCRTCMSRNAKLRRAAR